MIKALFFTVTCLKQSDHKLIAESKTLIPVHAKLVNISKQAQHATPPARHEKIATAFARHLLRLEVEVDSNVPSRVAREVRKFQNLSARKARLGIGYTEISLSQGIATDDSTMIVSFPPSSIRSEAGISTWSVNEIDHSSLLSFKTHSNQEIDIPCSPHQN